MICPKCGKEILDDSIFCSNCGTKLETESNDNLPLENEVCSSDLEKVTEENTDDEAKEEKKKVNLDEKTKKKIIIGSTAALVCAAAFIINSMPAVQYKKAEKAFANGNYVKAVSCYTAAVDYEDAKKKLKEATKLKGYTLGKEAFENKDYEKALEELIDANGYQDTKQMMSVIGEELTKKGNYESAINAFEKSDNKESQFNEYALGMVALADLNYREAADSFEKAGEILDAADQFNSAAYTYAGDQFNEKKYYAAGTYYKKVSAYKDAAELGNASFLLCANEFMKEGELKKAKEHLEKLPDNYSYDGINRDELLDILNKNSNWVQLDGKWSSTAGKAEAGCKSRNGWYNGGTWFIDSDKGEHTLDINCIFNNDNTVTVSGKGKITVFTDWSTVQIGLDYNKFYDISFKKTIPVSKFNESIWIDSYTSLKLGTDQLKLNYTYVDDKRDTSFIYTYTTNVTYGNKIVS